jgi:hypothetical protein
MSVTVLLEKLSKAGSTQWMPPFRSFRLRTGK